MVRRAGCHTGGTRGGPGTTADQVGAPTQLFLLAGVAVVLLTTVLSELDLLAAYYGCRLSIPVETGILR